MGIGGGFILVPVMIYLLRSEEHTSELQSRENLVCRRLLEKKNVKQRLVVAERGQHQAGDLRHSGPDLPAYAHAIVIFQSYGDHRDLHSFPTRRSSDLAAEADVFAESYRPGVAERLGVGHDVVTARSEEHTSELQSRENLVCRLLLEKKKKNPIKYYNNKTKKS